MLEFNAPPLLFILGAVICFVVAKVIQERSERPKQVCKEETMSHLIHYEEYETVNKDDDLIMAYREVYSYMVSGTIYEAKLEGAKDEKPIGTEERIAYNPSNPEESYFVNIKLKKKSGAPLLWLGIVLLILSLMTTLLTWQL